ncbi:MAG: hypothetical protein ABIR52_04835 [Casimicrobiaceae bacterium]
MRTSLGARAARAAAAAAVAALSTWSAPAAAAQLSDPAAPAESRWAGDVARLDAELQMRALVIDDPRGHWVAARFDATDPASQVRHYAAARAAAPRETLYLASLAIACQQPVQPSLPECDAVDRLADWATRDADNGVPLLLLASKAARRGNNEMAVAYLEQAAAKPRMDDYSARGALALWDYVMAMPTAVERAAKAEAAAAYAAEQPRIVTTGLAGACGGTTLPDTRKAACAQLGAALAERGTTFTARAAGATIAERTASDPAAVARSRTRQAANDALRARCAALDLDTQQGAESADATVRAVALAAWDARVRANAATGEVAACAQRAGS